MKVDERRKQIRKILENADGYLTVSEIAAKVNYSVRTVHNDLDVLEKNGLILSKKSGVGVKLVRDDFSENDSEEEQITAERRRLDLIRILLIDEKKITYQEIADRYYVSVSSVVNDVKVIREMFRGPDMIAIESSDVGTRFAGTNEQWFKSLSEFNRYLIGKENIGFEALAESKFLADFYDEKTLLVCRNLIDSFHEYRLAEEAYYYKENLFASILALTWRIEKGHHVLLGQKEFNASKVMEMTNYFVASDLLRMERDRFGKMFQYSTDDVITLSIILSANKVRFSKSTTVVNKDVFEIADQLIQSMEKILSISLSDDEELRESLLNHIGPLLFRLEHGIRIVNPMMEDIKSEFRNMFNLTWLAVENIADARFRKISDDEVGFLMLYFQNAVEEKRISRRILIVCPNGVVASNIIANRIEGVLPKLDIIEVSSIDKAKQYDLSEFSFVVTTVDIPQLSIPVVKVSMLVSEEDLRKIQRIYESVKNTEGESEKNGNQFREFLPVDNIYFSREECTREEVIDRVCTDLESRGYTEKEFRSALLAREANGGTDTPYGGAIPHGAVKYVNQTALAVWVSRKAIRWTNYRVNVVVFLALSEKDIKRSRQIINAVSELVMNKSNVQKLAAADSLDEVVREIYKGSLHD